MNELDKLGVINYLIFLYSEDYFISKSIEGKLDIKQLKYIAGQTPTYNRIEVGDVYAKMRNDYRLDKWTTCPNLLSKEFAL